MRIADTTGPPEAAAATAVSVLCVALTVFAAGMVSFVQAMMSRAAVAGYAPVNGGDDDSYERLGFNLACGLGFGYCPRDLEVIAGRAEPPAASACIAGCTAGEFAPTAYRPPGFPLLVAAVYRVRPLDFRLVRWINCLLNALAVSLVAGWFARRLGVWTGLLAGILPAVDPRVREFAGTFLTENSATLGLVSFTLLWTTFLERRTARWGIAAGLTFGALVLTRSFYVAWYPALWLWAAVALGRNVSDASIVRRLRPVAAFALASIALTAPWWIRNCMVLDAWMPTGTQGGIGIADGFSDSAMRNHGSWTSETADSIAAAMRADPQLAGLTPIGFEREHARRGAASAQQWIRTHRGELLKLSWWKFARLWESESPAHWVLWSLLACGLLIARHHSLAVVVAVLLAVNSLTVVATYHTYERFLLPFRPLIHGFAAVAFVKGAMQVRWWLRG